MAHDDAGHSPDYPFGCGASWGEPAVRDGGLHVCNLSNTHYGQDHECKCGETSAEPKPPPGPPVAPRCRECGGPRSIGGAIRHHESGCSISQEGQRRWQVEREITAAFTEALAEKRKDTEFMDRLHRNVTKHKDLLDRLAVDD